MRAYGNIDVAIEAMKRGAYDYVAKPFRPDEVVLVLKKAEERERLRRENAALKRELASAAKSDARAAAVDDRARGKMQEILRTIPRSPSTRRRCSSPARAAPARSWSRARCTSVAARSGPFVAVNCGAIPESLLESSCSGTRRARSPTPFATRSGLFEEADGGTLFLDEIGELPLALQVKLLRVLQEREVRPVGSRRGPDGRRARRRGDACATWRPR